MKKIFKIISFICLLSVVISVCFCLPAAAASGSISLSANPVTVGQSLTVTCTFNADTGMYAYNAGLSYNPDILTCTTNPGSDGTSKYLVSEFLSGEKSYTFSVSFTAKAAGTVNLVFTAEGSDGTSKMTYSGSRTVTVNAQATPTPTPPTPSKPSTPGGQGEVTSPSSDASLLSIKVSGGELIPTFSKDVTNYTANVKYDVDKVTLSATAASGASVVGTGTFDLEIGNNNHTLTVTAADGKSKKSYNINIRRMTKEETEAYEKSQQNGNPLSVTVGGKNLLITPDISALGTYNGYVLDKAMRGETEVTYLKDTNGSYKLYYMTDSSGKGRYYNQTLSGDFEEIAYIISGLRLYITKEIPSNIDLGDIYESKTLMVNDISVPTLRFKQKAAKDIYIIYCYFEGEMGYYRYDSLEKTISRAPEFALENYKSGEGAGTNKTLLSRFLKMNSAGKTVVVLIFFASLAIVSIIVLLITKIVKEKPKRAKKEKPLPNSEQREVEIVEEDTSTAEPEKTEQKDDF